MLTVGGAFELVGLGMDSLNDDRRGVASASEPISRLARLRAMKV